MNPAGGGATQAGQPQSVAASRRMMAWKWTAPRFWYSATLAKEMRTSRSQFGLGHAGELGQRPMQVDGGPRPQPTGQGVPQDLGAGLVAAGTQRLPQPGVVGVVALPAARPAAMRAPLALPVGMAGVHQPPLGLAGVDPAEGWRGEGHEQPWMGGHRLGDALAAPQPSGQELEAVGLVGRRAGGAHRRPPVAARLEQGGVRLPARSSTRCGPHPSRRRRARPGRAAAPDGCSSRSPRPARPTAS